MDGMRVAKAFLRKAAVYAQQHDISSVVAVDGLPAGFIVSERALQTLKIQVSNMHFFEFTKLTHH